MDKKKKFSVKDIIVILLSGLAVVGLVFIIWSSNQRQQQEEKYLEEISSEYESSGHRLTQSEAAENLVINEVNQGGFVELYNCSDRADIPLDGCIVSVNGQKKYEFTQGQTLKAGGFVCVDNLGTLQKGDIVSFSLTDAEPLVSLMVPELPDGASYARTEDGGIAFGIKEPSREESNANAENLAVTDLEFSVPGGFYDNAFSLELSAGEGMKIYYTLDGSEPTEDSLLYEGPINIQNRSGSSNMVLAVNERMDYPGAFQPSGITMGTVVKAVAVDARGNAGEVETRSYFVGVTNAADVANMPVISISTDAGNLFDYYEGIYVKGRTYEDAIAMGADGGGTANYYNNWQREVTMEFFDDKKDKTYEEKMSMGILIDISTTAAQKGLVLYGQGQAQMGSGLENFYHGEEGSITLQTHLHDNAFMTRDYLAANLLRDTTVQARDMELCAVFLNGEYWGVYMLKGEYDAEMIAEKYGVDADNVSVIQYGIDGSSPLEQHGYSDLYRYVTENDLSVEANYRNVTEQMDVDNYLEYFCANMYLANSLYGSDYVTAWRTDSAGDGEYEDGRWRYLMPRMDGSMANSASSRLSTDSIDSYLMPSVTEDAFFRSLMQNAGFREKLQSTMERMAAEVFAPEKAERVLNDLTTARRKVTVNNYRRFVGNMDDSAYMREAANLLEFFQNRGDFILKYTEEEVSGERSVDTPAEETMEQDNTVNQVSEDGTDE